MISKLWAMTTLLILSLLITAPQILAQEPAGISLKQTDNAATGQLVVNVVVSNVAGLYGAEVHLRYDPLILQAVDADPNQEAVQVEPGAFLAPEHGFVVANQVDEALGSISYAVTLLNPAPPVTGQGILFKAAFDILRPNASTLDIEQAKLVAHSLETIPSQAHSMSFGSAPALTEKEARLELAQEDNINWIVVGGIIVVLGLALGVVAALVKVRNGN